MRQFDKRKGTFKPQRIDDLQDDVSACVGMHCTWEAIRLIEDGDYAGQWAMVPLLNANDMPNVPFAWTPECDIEFDENETPPC